LYVILLIWVTSYRVFEMLCNIQDKCIHYIAVCTRNHILDDFLFCMYCMCDPYSIIGACYRALVVYDDRTSRMAANNTSSLKLTTVS
jgi:hypothetical protein